ncbi:MAG: NAD(P)/FAD-dependent oxidoreductase [Patescibacteria group bacterium]
MYDVAIIGAGAAGIMAALSASENSKSVILIEKNQIIGRKILATGNGRCNLTNQNVDASRFHGAEPSFIKNVLSQFDQVKTMRYFESLGLILKEEDNGRIFPRTNQASTIVEALGHELNRKKVTVRTNCLVKEIKHDSTWKIKTENGQEILAKKLILTTGGKAAHQLGSSGDGLFWIEKIGHTVTPIYAALVPIETIESWPKDIQGLKIEGTANVVVNEKTVDQKHGDILFTHYGLSGPAIMGLSRTIAPLLEKSKVMIKIDTIPEETNNSLDEKINKVFSINGVKSVKNALAGIVPTNLVLTILKNLSINPDKKAAEISRSDRQIIVETLKNLTLTVSKTRPLKEAQVTSGGILSSEIDSKTMKSRNIPDLYFAGEIVDVDGDSGGFNLQWAWSSGYVAGKSANK